MIEDNYFSPGPKMVPVTKCGHKYTLRSPGVLLLILEVIVGHQCMKKALNNWYGSWYSQLEICKHFIDVVWPAVEPFNRSVPHVIHIVLHILQIQREVAVPELPNSLIWIIHSSLCTLAPDSNPDAKGKWEKHNVKYEFAHTIDNPMCPSCASSQTLIFSLFPLATAKTCSGSLGLFGFLGQKRCLTSLGEPLIFLFLPKLHLYLL